MEGIPLKRSKIVDVSKCIICQKDKSKSRVISTEAGRIKLIDAASRRQDDLYDRIQNIKEEEIKYHVDNFCFKNYTHKNKLDSIGLNETKVDGKSTNYKEGQSSTSSPISTPISTRSKSTPRPAASQDNTHYMQTRVCCGYAKHKGEYEKFRLSESDRAKKFLDAAVFFQDETYLRTCDLQDISAVFGADLYFHKNCVRKYLLKYDRADAKNEVEPTESPKITAFKHFISEIEHGLQNGAGYVLSVLRDHINENNSNSFTNQELKILFIHRYGDNLRISYPNQRNESIMVFLDDIEKEDLANVIRENDYIHAAAEEIREDVKAVEFDLQGRFCESTDLQESWNKTKIPEPLVRFLCILTNLNPNNLKDMIKVEMIQISLQNT